MLHLPPQYSITYYFQQSISINKIDIVSAKVKVVLYLLLHYLLIIIITSLCNKFARS